MRQLPMLDSKTLKFKRPRVGGLNTSTRAPGERTQSAVRRQKQPISRSQTVGSGYCTLATCDNDQQRGSSPVVSGPIFLGAMSLTRFFHDGFMTKCLH